MRRGETPGSHSDRDGLARVLDATGTLRDAKGAVWTVDGLLGRGAWGTSWAVRSPDGVQGVLKVPHDADALDAADDPAGLATACAAAAAATRSDLEARRHPWLPVLLGSVRGGDGTLGLITRRYGASLESRLAGGMPLVDAVALVVRVLRLLTGAGGAVHGNLRPSNVLLDDDGSPVLADALVEPLGPAIRALEHASGRASYLPPDASGGRVHGGQDTWALCLALHRAAALPGGLDEGGSRKLDLPREGLGRVQLATVKDAAAARLKAEHANKRFASRAVTKLGAVLNRGLSVETDPSPPYRFRTAADLLERLVEVDELLRPSIEVVSRLMLGQAAKDGVFEGGEAVAFAVNVGATAGVTAQDDLAVGIQLVDRDAPGDGRVRVSDARVSVDRYPSGKWRYEFVLPDVAPGRYRARAAFAVKDSGDDPIFAEGEFEVRPRPGYVPPERGDDDLAPAIPLPTAASAPRPPEPVRRYDDEDDDDYDAPPQGAVVELAALRRGLPARPVLPDEDRPSFADEDAPPSRWRNDPPSWSSPPVSPPRALPPAPPIRPPPVAPVTVAATPAQAPRVATPPVRLADDGGTDWDAPRATSPSQVPATRPDYADVPSIATHPGMGFTQAEVDDLDPLDPALSDYPSPTHPGTAHTFTDLPAYDDLDVRGQGAFERAREELLRRFRRDPWTAFVALSAGAFVLFLLVVAFVKYLL